MKFRKKPVVIEASQLTRQNGPQLAEWCGGRWLSLYGRGDRGEDISHVSIPTLEGTMCADLGDWIIKGVKGEFYPCKPDIFKVTYEPAGASHVDAVCPGCGTFGTEHAAGCTGPVARIDLHLGTSKFQ